MNPGILRKLSLIVTINSKAALGKIKALQARFAAFSKAAIAKLKLIGIAAALVFAGFAASAVAAGTAFEFEMTKVAAISGATEEELKRLTETARLMGATTAFTAREAAAGLLDLARSGMTTANQIETLQDVLHLAGGAGEDMATAANLVAATMKQFNLEASESTRIVDNFSTILDKTLFQSLSEIQTAMGRAGTTAATFGISLEKITALSGALRNVGVDASMVGTQIRMAFLKLSSPMARGRAILEKYGLTVADVNPRLVEIEDILQKLADSGMVAEEMFRVLGVRQSGFVNVVKQVRNGVNDYNKLLGDLADKTGRAADKYAQMMDTIQGRMKIMKSAMQEAQLALFDSLEPVLKKFTSIGKVLMDRLADSIKNNADEITNFAERILRTGVAFGQFIAHNKAIIILVAKVGVGLALWKITLIALSIPLGLILKGFLLINGAVLKTVGLMSLMTWQVTLAVAAIVGLIVIFTKFHKQIGEVFDTAKQKSDSLWESLNKNTADIPDKILKGFRTAFNWIWGAMVALMRSLGTLGTSFWDVISGNFKFEDFKKEMANIWTDSMKADWWGDLGTQTEKGIDKIIGGIKKGVSGVKDAWKDVKNIFTGDVDLSGFIAKGGEEQISSGIASLTAMGKVRGLLAERQREAAKQFGFGGGVGGMLPDPEQAISQAEEVWNQIRVINGDFYNDDTEMFATTLDKKHEMFLQWIENQKQGFKDLGKDALLAFEGMTGAYKGMNNAVEKMALSFFNNENRRQKVLLLLTKQTAMGATAAVLDSIAEMLRAKAQAWAIEAGAMFWQGNFASAAGLLAAAAAAGVGATVATAGATSIRERMDRELAAATNAPRPLTEGEREGGVVVPQALGSSPGSQAPGSTVPNMNVTFQAETQVFSQEGVEGIKLALKQDQLKNHREFQDSGQV